MSTSKSNFLSSPISKSRITSDDVKMPEMLLGYFIGPFGALLSSGIFTSILQNYFTDVLKLDLGFLTTLQLVSTVLIVASNLIVGQLIEHTKALAGKARPWILLSALTLSVASVLMLSCRLRAWPRWSGLPSRTTCTTQSLTPSTTPLTLP